MNDSFDTRSRIKNPSANSKNICNGRALDSVSQNKSIRPNRQKVSEKCPKMVCLQLALSVDNFWTFSDIFLTFFGHFVDIPCLWAVQRFARYNKATDCD